MSAAFTSAVVVGNPKPNSRTLAAAYRVTETLTGAVPDLSIDLACLGASLLDLENRLVADLVEQVRAADLLVVASPTYKASFTGMLKVFLDRFPHEGLRGCVAVPLMLGASERHALAPELTLRPVLAELGASVPASGLYVLESAYDDASSYDPWAHHALPLITAVLEAPDLTTGVQS